jgi:hypothetical protein
MELSAAISHCVARARTRILRQERLAPFADMEHDGSGFEEDEAVFFEDRHLPEGLQRTIVGFVLIALFKETRLVGQAGFLQRPARAQIAHLALGEVWNPLERGDRDHVVCSLAIS